MRRELLICLEIFRILFAEKLLCLRAIDTSKEVKKFKTIAMVARSPRFSNFLRIVQKQIDDILHRKTAWEKMQKLQAAEQEGNTDEAKAIADAEPVKIELTAETVKELGAPGQFSSVEEFKAKIREHLEIEKKNEVASKHKAAITDAIVEATTLELPDILIDTEIKQMFAQMEDDLTRANLKMDDYLSHVKKTRDDMRAEWMPMAEKRAKLQLILEAI